VVSAIAIVLAGAAAATAVAVLDRRLDRFSLTTPDEREGTTTWLLIGSDSRRFVRTPGDRERFGDTGDVPDERADIVLAASVPDHGAPAVVVIPRDLVVRTDEGRPRRLATVWSGGPQPFVDILCRELGIGADHVVAVEFDGLRRMVDAVGGVEVTVDAPVRDTVTGLHLEEPGTPQLTGEEALAWVRSRSMETRRGQAWVPRPRSERGIRATAVVRAVLAETSPLLRHPVRTTRLLLAATDSLSVDRGVGVRDLVRLARRLDGGYETVSLPVDTIEAAVPVATLRPAARSALERFGPSPRCPGRALR
jgi:LCP family protein required for cell wall assembly